MGAEGGGATGAEGGGAMGAEGGGATGAEGGGATDAEEGGGATGEEIFVDYVRASMPSVRAACGGLPAGGRRPSHAPRACRCGRHLLAVASACHRLTRLRA